MTESEQEPWQAFAVGEPSETSNWIESSCQELDTVYHVTHLHHSIRILQDQRIRPTLIYDKSILNTTRTSVVWLSPNYWAHGSRYGNISFEFNWKELIKRKNYYWVEVIDSYSPPACRILVTDQDFSKSLKAYDPRDNNGPWVYNPHNDTHYWNGDYCLEFMITSDIYAHESQCVSFVKHHNDFCNINPGACPDKGMRSLKATKLFCYAFIAYNMKDADISSARLSLADDKERGIFDVSELYDVIEHTLEILGQLAGGAIKGNSGAGLAIARGIYHEMFYDNGPAYEALSKLFASKDDLIAACTTLFNQSFSLPKSNPPSSV